MAHRHRGRFPTRSTRPCGRLRTRRAGQPGQLCRPSRLPSPHLSRGLLTARRASCLAKLDGRVAVADSAPQTQRSPVSLTWRATDDGDDTEETTAEVIAAGDIGTVGTEIA